LCGGVRLNGGPGSRGTRTGRPPRWESGRWKGSRRNQPLTEALPYAEFSRPTTLAVLPETLTGV